MKQDGDGRHALGVKEISTTALSKSPASSASPRPDFAMIWPCP